MKTLIKRHLIGVFALVLTVATMSFKMVENRNTVGDWYPVHTDGYTITSSTPIDKPNNVDCQENNPATICAVEIILSSAPFPSNLDEAADFHTLTGETTERAN